MAISSFPVRNSNDWYAWAFDVDAAIRVAATLASPAFSGAPTVPTANPGTATTQAASTAFVSTALASFMPLTLPSAQTGSYTLTLLDAGRAVEVTSTAANTVTVPTNAAAAYPVGTVIEHRVASAARGRLLGPGRGRDLMPARRGIAVRRRSTVLTNTSAGSFALAGSGAASNSVSAPAFVRQNTAASTSAGSTSRTQTITLPQVAASHSLILSYSSWTPSNNSAPAVPITGVTDSSSNTWTSVVADNNPGGVGQLELWYCKNPAVTGSTLTVSVTAGTFSGATYVAMNLSEWSKVLFLRTSALVNSATANPTTQSATVSSATNDLVFVNQSRADNGQLAPVAPAAALTFVNATNSAHQPGYVVASGSSTTVNFGTGSATAAIGTVIASFSN
ncbi:hypothetical protein Q3G72_022829 [Acer saccharum]|nr:hypothetical protein Q3G72_022829 [Acer saccharum]